MIPIAVSQRVGIDQTTGERRDQLDQRWHSYLQHCGLVPILIPNHISTAQKILSKIPVRGVLLTGGNSLVDLGGDAPERDTVEDWLITHAETASLPLIGVCRGMQSIQHHYGVSLQAIDGHVGSESTITIEGKQVAVNSSHNFGATESTDPLRTWLTATDGIVEAVQHVGKPITGIMWHPERCATWSTFDTNLFCSTFGSTCTA